ncbi:hypothetical protein A3709_20385 [Halioglobus sp. HI00S01]|uniref:hypothetical protein n=1 Tax=Halioglobus sp. HI00S01 TaxID=1822214 RepID=UPI0007C1FE6A|nr:hypothetical protein [Halioglobus sp. HI00S01]KZX57972.1 hypothetical protein A3709_20385 [Halioglobus sp. HI00S01]
MLIDITDRISERLDREALAKIDSKQRDILLKKGAVVHNVMPSDDRISESTWNHHTHFLEEIAGHPDFQIKLDIDPRLASTLLFGAVDQVYAGTVFEPGLCDTIIAETDVAIRWAHEGGRDVLRIILPDSEFSLDPSSMAEPYRSQWENCTPLVRST